MMTFPGAVMTMMMTSRSLRRPLSATAALTAARLAPVAAGPAAAAATEAASAQVSAASCPLPLVHDIYDGFHVGVPSGWDLSTMNSEIAVEPSPSSPEGVILYPALLTGGTTASQVFSGFMSWGRPVADGVSDGRTQRGAAQRRGSRRGQWT
jgi:hypothetical protein